ncbi:helix-turn-helix domain-containing protein [Kitasatospora sp. NPDC127067]|uniref:helix-turn-helix domain-containing protein n=1 Tax=Kitasatospora sp. NPDC127067 TaxID=3347126 RepID=UPI003667E197
MSVETEEFAAMLRELKERSGRSYGALATRLHVSTSTLHRYCNGAAVPTEYAPVERLARVCGAGGEELVELHRRWILADAARRREASSAGTPAAAAPAPTPTPAPTPQPQPEAEPRLRPEAAPDPQSAAAPEEEQEVTTTHLAPPPAGPRHRIRTRVLLSATAVVALAAVASGLLLRDTGGTGGTGGTPNASASSPASSPISPSVAATAGAGTAPTGAPAPPAPAGSAAPDTPSAAPAAPEDLPAPFHVSVLSNGWGSPCDQWFLSARSPAQVTPPPSSSGRIDSWAASQRLVPAGHLRIELTALGASSDAVVLNSMSVQVVSTRPAPKWNAYTPGSGCGGGLEPASFAVDLDAATPRLVPVAGREGERRTGTTDFPYRISATDPQVIDVDAATRSQDVSWFLELVWTGKDGRKGTMRVDLGDQQPFRTVGMQGAPNYIHNGTSWAPAHNEG